MGEANLHLDVLRGQRDPSTSPSKIAAIWSSASTYQ
jgi:hypothetical protein